MTSPTPEQRAEALLRIEYDETSEIHTVLVEGRSVLTTFTRSTAEETAAWWRGLFAAAEERGVARERERCAGIAEAIGDDPADELNAYMRQRIAAAIRRGTP